MLLQIRTRLTVLYLRVTGGTCKKLKVRGLAGGFPTVPFCAGARTRVGSLLQRHHEQLRVDPSAVVGEVLAVEREEDVGDGDEACGVGRVQRPHERPRTGGDVDPEDA